MHNRRARPTLRVLREDLDAGWTDPGPKRALDDGRVNSLLPLSELPHPFIARAAECFSEDSSEDNFERPIVAATDIVLLEIKSSQWRGGVWIDPATGVCWLLAAGLAKGGHNDFDDFYKAVERENKSTKLQGWMPGEEDFRLLKLETAAKLRTEWELDIQRQVLRALRTVHSGGSHDFEVSLPHSSSESLATVTITVEQFREGGQDIDTDDVVVEIDPVPQFAAHDLLWILIVRVLCSISPPEQGWDRFDNTFSNIGEPGAWEKRTKELESLVLRQELQFPEPGKESHYTHREHLSRKTIDGKAVRAMCGVRFVPSRDHAKLPLCPECAQLYRSLP